MPSTPRSPSGTTTTPSPSPLTGGGRLARNALGNLASQCAPMIAAVLTVPVLIGGLGADRFGLLTLSWMLLGYFSLFDLGLGRALTRLVAEKLGLGREDEIPGLVGAGLVLMLAFGLMGALLIAALVPWLVASGLKVPAGLHGEARGAFYLMAVALPFLIGTAGLRGVMEAYQRVGAVNVVRTVVGLFSLIGPLGVLPFSRNLVLVVGVIVAGRVGSWLVHLAICLRTVPGLSRGFTLRGTPLRPLLGFGGWMTLANVINPIMVQMDRFFIGGLISTAAVAYYTTPYELVTKSWFFSGAVVGVVFPAFATSYAQDRRRTALIFGRGVKYVFLILFPLTLVAAALAPEVLRVWLGPDFARQSTRVMQWLAVGVFLNGLAHVPSAMLQGVGRPDLTALLHVVELPLYLAVAWWLIVTRGIEGAAMAWTARTALDLLLFFGTAGWVLPAAGTTMRHLARALPPALLLLAGCAAPESLAVRAPLLLAIAGPLAALAWRRGLTPEERGWILGKLAGARPPRPSAAAVAGAGAVEVATGSVG
jgi:O-antigen/teichoic acid export membrane protein